MTTSLAADAGHAAARLTERVTTAQISATVFLTHQSINQSVNRYAVFCTAKNEETRMWANAQRDGRPAEYRWRPLFNAAVWLTPTTRVPCSNAAKTPNPLKFAGVPQTNETISAASRPKFTILWGHLEEILLLNKFFSDCRYVP